MIDINVNVKVELSEKSVELLKGLFTQGSVPAPVAPAPASEPDMPDFSKPEPKAVKPTPAPASSEITDADLRPVVKAAKDRAGAKAVRDLFGEMGIASSVECPQERRSELVAKLNELN